MPTFPASDGAVIAYSDEGAGTPIVLVPGICCSKRWWNLPVQELSRSCRVVRIDLRGVGDSPYVARGHRVARYAKDVAELIEHLDLHDVVLVGWSLGYSISLAYIDLAGQDRLAALVLIEGSPKLLNDEGWELGIADLEAAVRMTDALNKRYPTEVEGLLRSFVDEPADVGDFDGLLAEALAADPASIARLFWDHVNQDWRDVLPTVRVRALVVAGADSRMVTPDAARWTASMIRSAQLEIFEGAGHSPFLHRPTRFVSLVQALAGSVRPAGAASRSP